MKAYIARLVIENEKGEAVATSMERLPIWATTNRTKLFEGPDAIRMALAGAITWVVDLSHVGYTLIELLAGATVPEAVINEKGQMLRITGAGETYIRNASAIVPTEGDLFTLRDIFCYFGLGKSKKDPYTIAGIAREQLAMIVPELKWFCDGSMMSDDAYQAARYAYRGGLLYVKPGEYGCGTLYDVNSLYPYIMESRRLPIGSPHNEKDGLRRPLWIGRVSIKSIRKKEFLGDKQYVDWLPCVFSFTLEENEDGSRRMRPTWMTQVDYAMILRYYDVEGAEASDLYWYESMEGEKLFGYFINFWYKIKSWATKTGERSQRIAAKLILNSVSGSFGRSDVYYSKVPYYDVIDMTHKKVKYKYTASENTAAAKLSGYMPVAAFITAYGRYEIVAAANSLNWKGHPVTYINTDGFIAAGKDYSDRSCTAVWIGDDIGLYKREFEAEKMHIFGANSYVLENKNSVKALIPGLMKKDLLTMDDKMKRSLRPGITIKGTRWEKVPGGKVETIIPITIGGGI